MQKIENSQKEPILKAIEPKEDIYDLYSYSTKTRKKVRPIIKIEESTDNLNKIYIKTDSNYLNMSMAAPRNKKINHKYSFSFSECVPNKKYLSKFRNYNNSKYNINKNNDINYVYIPGISYNSFLTEINEKNQLPEFNNEKLMDTFQQTDKIRTEDFDEQLYNKLMFFDNLANNITKEQIYAASEYIINKEKKEIKRPEFIIHNIFLTLVIKDISKKIEIRRLKDNKLISIDFVYNLLQNEIEKMKGGLKKSMKIIKNKKENHNSQNSLLGIQKVLNTDFITYLHFSKSHHIRNKSFNNNSETRYSDDESDFQGKKLHHIHSSILDNSLKNNNSGIIYENEENFIHSEYNQLRKNYDESDRCDYSNLMDLNDNNYINHNSPYQLIKNHSGYIKPNLLQKEIFVNNKNIDFIDSISGKSIFKDDGSFNISFYDKNGNKIKNPDLNDKSITYFDKNGYSINIKKVSKIKLYDQQGNLIENPNLDDSNINYYDENGKIINTQSRIQFQLYDKKGKRISKIDDSGNVQYYDSEGNPIPKNEIPINYYYNNKKEIKSPKDYKFIDNDEGNKIMIPEGFKYIINKEGEKILVNEKGNQVNEECFIINEDENSKNYDESESEIEVEGVNEKGEKIKMKIKKKDLQKNKKKKKSKKKRKKKNNENEEYYSDNEDESESEYEEEEIEVLNEKGEKVKIKVNDSLIKKIEKKKKTIKYKNENGEEITLSENEKEESEYEEEEFEEEVEEEIEEIDENGNSVKKKIKKIKKKKIPKKKKKKTKNNENKNIKDNKKKKVKLISNNLNNNINNISINKKEESEKNEGKENKTKIKNLQKTKSRNIDVELSNETTNKSKETKFKTQDYNISDLHDNSIKSIIKNNQNLNNEDINNINYNEESFNNDNDYDYDNKDINEINSDDESDEEKKRRIDEYEKEAQEHQKLMTEYYNNMQKTNLTFYKKQKEKVDPFKIRKLIEETKKKTLGITENSDVKITDEEIYNKISIESDLFKEWTKIGNNHRFKDYNLNNVHSGNYSKVGQGEFLIYKGKNYFENKKEDTESKSLPPEFVNWLQSELRKLKNAYSLKKKEPEIKDEYTFKLNDQNTESEISTKRRKRIRKEIPKKRLNNKRLKTIKKPEEIEIKNEETMPLPISRSESSESSRSVNNQNSLRYMFQEIQKLKNLPPEEYTKKVNSLLDFQLDNAIVMVHRKHADRINRFIHNLEDFRKSRANYQKYKSRKLSYLPPISIKKVNSENIFNLKKNYLSEEKVKATDNILVPKNKTKNIIETMKV